MLSHTITNHNLPMRSITYFDSSWNSASEQEYCQCRDLRWTDSGDSYTLPQPPQIAVKLPCAPAAGGTAMAPPDQHHSGPLGCIQQDSFVNMGADGPSISAKPGQKVRCLAFSNLHILVTPLVSLGDQSASLVEWEMVGRARYNPSLSACL
jgi:hypothetical protein